MEWLRRFALIFIFSSICLAAQQEGPLQSGSSHDSMPSLSMRPTLTPRSHEERERSYQVEHRIILNVEVTDASGRQVTGLKDEDFTLLDGQHSRKISSIRAINGDTAAARAHVILLLDTLNANSKNITYERKGIEKFLSLNHGRLSYPISIAVLSSAGVRVSGPSQNGESLIADLERLSNGLRSASCADEAGDGGMGKSSSGGSIVAINGAVATEPESQFSKRANCENQRFKISLSQLGRLAREEVDVPGRAILVWIGAGWPQLTGPGFSPDTAQTKRNFFDHLVELSTELREAQITLDAVSFPDSMLDEEPHAEADKALSEGVASEEQATAGSMALRVLAHDTGGQIFPDSKDLAGSVAACLADAASYYVVAFDSEPAQMINEYHRLQVMVARPGLRVRTTSAYYSQQ